MQIRCTLLCLLLVACYMYMVAAMGSINKRELLSKDRDMFKELREKLTALEKRLESRPCSGFSKNDISITYTRWGRTECPGRNTELVYSGYVGGSEWTHKGAAVDYLCMPKNPDWNYKYTNGTAGGKGYVFGAEYETYNGHIGIGKSYRNHDVPCAVCITVGSTSALMVPGKTKCEKSWTKQYTGYLMTGQYNHGAASQYICVDKDAETIPGSSADKNGKLLYPVEARCGSLKCPPYYEGRELACVVCTKG